MTPERYQQVDRLYQQALDCPPGQRVAFVAEACHGDEELRREVESLLASAGQAVSFLEAPAQDVAVAVIGQEATASMAGRKLGPYELKSLLGTGGMGRVYLTEDTRLKRRVALKLLPRDYTTDPERLHRFRQEARAASALNHPNILTIYDIGIQEGVHYIATEFVEGATLRQKLSRGALDPSEALGIATQVAEALSAAHEAGIIHRDIKPDNVMVRADGYVKVLDFGLAKLVQQPGIAATETTETRVRTHTGVLMGTVSYMSPEQARGEPVDSRTDIFSLGVVLYEMLAGRRPFQGNSWSDTLAALLTTDPPQLSETRQDVPDGLEMILRRALEKDRLKRYSSAAEMGQDLRQLMGSSLPGTQVRALKRRYWEGSNTAFRNALVRAAGRRPGLVALSLAAALILGIAGFVLLRPTPSSIDSIAVLAFANGTGNPGMEYLSEGIAESLINSLSQIPRVRVKSRNSVLRYKGKAVDVQTVGAELRVGAVVTGRLLQQGDGLTIKIELDDARTNDRLWGAQYDYKVSDLVRVQETLAREIARNLHLRLSSAEEDLVTKRYTENSEAYQLYLQGRFYLNQRSADAIRQGQKYFRQAIEKDAGFAYAYSGLSDSFALLAAQGAMNPKEAYAEARRTASRAVELDRYLAEAHTSLAHVQLHTGELAQSQEEFKRALELKPNYALAHHFHAEYWARMERLDEAIAAEQRAIDLDPMDLASNAMMGFYLGDSGQLERSETQYRKTLELNPNYFLARLGLGQTYLAMGRSGDAIVEFIECVRVTKRVRGLGFLGYAYALAGQREEAEKILEEMKQRAPRQFVAPLELALVYTALGKKSEAFAWLEKATADPETARSVRRNRLFDTLRQDARYAEVIRRSNAEIR